MPTIDDPLAVLSWVVVFAIFIYLLIWGFIEIGRQVLGAHRKPREGSVAFFFILLTAITIGGFAQLPLTLPLPLFLTWLAINGIGVGALALDMKLRNAKPKERFLSPAFWLFIIGNLGCLLAGILALAGKAPSSGYVQAFQIVIGAGWGALALIYAFRFCGKLFKASE